MDIKEENKKLLLSAGALFFVMLMGIVSYFWYKFESTQNLNPQLVVEVAEQVNPGFTSVVSPKDFKFPEDHGPHNDYQTEWWYYTGNLADKDGRRFGYQLTFFRRALLPEKDRVSRESEWATDHVYMAHFTVTDVQKGKFQVNERFSRGAAKLAGAYAEPFQVWLENWVVEEYELDQVECLNSSISPCAYRLFAADKDVELELILKDLKGPVLQGNEGYSQKGPALGQASYYYSLTRLITAGRLVIGDDDYSVEGSSWMDHEFSTSVLSKDQIGWDWFSLQLDNNLDLMVFQIRKADGSIDPFSSGRLVYSDGESINLERGDFSIQVEDTWISPHSKAEYPSGWILEIPRIGMNLQITPLLKDQELNVSYSYWEGAVQVVGNYGTEVLEGYGYVEMTGYAESIGGEF